MKVILAGAGEVGFHLAKLLSFEQHDIILIDNDDEVLEYAASHLDVGVLKGDCSSPSVMRKAEVQQADLVITVTTSEKTNLITSVLAKSMGAKRTIARVTNPEYIADINKHYIAELGVDNLISPTYLAGKEIHRLLERTSVTDIFEFEEGRVSLFGITIDASSPIVNQTLEQISFNVNHKEYKLVAILRGHRTILPTSSTVLKSFDHLYFITKTERFDDIMQMVGKEKRTVKDVMILGGSAVAYETARQLESDYRVKLFEPNKEACAAYSERLDNTLIIYGQPGNTELLKEEGVEQMDVLIALTPSNETNILSCLMGKELGVYKTIALVENIEYTYLSQNIGVDTIINKKLIAANNIFRFVRKGNIEALTGLVGVNAEIIEYIVSKNNRATKKPISELHLSDKIVFASVIRDGVAYFPAGDFKMKLGDKVIVLAQDDAIAQIDKLLR